MKSIDELSSDLSFTTAKAGAERTVTFLPEPPRAQRRYTVISVDDHIVEPPDTFLGRVPRKLADRAPRVVETDTGQEMLSPEEFEKKYPWKNDPERVRLCGE